MRHKWKETGFQRRECERCGLVEQKQLVPAQFGNKWLPVYYPGLPNSLKMPKCTEDETKQRTAESSR